MNMATLAYRSAMLVVILMFGITCGFDFAERGIAAEPEPAFVIVANGKGAGNYAAFPDVCRLNDGRLMCVFYASYHHIGLPKPEWPNGGRVAYCVSSDEGFSWSKPEVLFDGPDDDRDPSIVQLKNGRLICNFFQLRRNADRSLPCADPYQEPYTPLGTWIVTSDDVGKTWSEPQRVAPDYFVSSPVRELSTGRLVMPLYAEKAKTAFGAVSLSDDGGKTWSNPVDLDNAGKTLDAETDLIETKPGMLYAALRGSHCPMHFVTSSDAGKTWSSARAVDFVAHSPYLHRTTDGVIVLGYRQVTDHMNTALRVSRDGGQIWSEPVVIDEVVGAYPSMVNLKDGSTLVVYYEEGQNSSIRARRFRVTDAEVQFLPMRPQ